MKTEEVGGSCLCRETETAGHNPRVGAAFCFLKSLINVQSLVVCRSTSTSVHLFIPPPLHSSTQAAADCRYVEILFSLFPCSPNPLRSLTRLHANISLFYSFTCWTQENHTDVDQPPSVHSQEVWKCCEGSFGVSQVETKLIWFSKRNLLNNCVVLFSGAFLWIQSSNLKVEISISLLFLLSDKQLCRSCRQQQLQQSVQGTTETDIKRRLWNSDRERGMGFSDLLEEVSL